MEKAAATPRFSFWLKVKCRGGIDQRKPKTRGYSAGFKEVLPTRKKKRKRTVNDDASKNQG